jgi:hypothetical protein
MAAPSLHLHVVPLKYIMLFTLCGYSELVARPVCCEQQVMPFCFMEEITHTKEWHDRAGHAMVSSCSKGLIIFSDVYTISISSLWSSLHSLVTSFLLGLRTSRVEFLAKILGNLAIMRIFLAFAAGDFGYQIWGFHGARCGDPIFRNATLCVLW